MSSTAPIEQAGDLSWQAVAIELIRRRAGAAPTMSTERLRRAGAPHESELFRRYVDSHYFLTCGIDHPRQRLYQALWNVQLEETRAVVGELVALNVPTVIFKGLEVGARYDRNQGVGVRSDVDLLLPLGALWKLRKVLYGRGYVHGKYQVSTRTWIDHDPHSMIQHETTAYELMPFVKAVPVAGLDDAALAEARHFPNLFCVHDDVVLVFACFDVHHNILFKLDVAPFFERSVPSRIGVGRALSPADHLWFSIHRYYYEVATGDVYGPRVLASIAPMVCDPEIDWDLVVRDAIAQRATSPCLYWLSFFRKLGAAAVPDRVLAALRSQRGKCQRDWGWQLARLFELDEQFPDLPIAGSARAGHTGREHT